MASQSGSRPHPAVVLAVLERDGYQCRGCGKKGHPGLGSDDLQVHHKTPRRNGGTHEPDNLETLCGTCHKETDKAYWLQELRAGSARAKARRQQLSFTEADALALGDQWLNPAAAAEYLGVSEIRVRQMLREGKLPGKKMGRDWFIIGRDLAHVVVRYVGWQKDRPRKKDSPSA